MVTVALRPCAEPGCPTLTDKRRCPLHRRQLEQARGTRQQRGYDRDYDQLHDQVLEEEPWCRWCGDPSTTVDHIVPLVEGGTNERDNLCGACGPCQYGHGGRLSHGISGRPSR